MNNKQYTQGRQIEYKIVNYYKNKGYYACRTAGSHGPFDVIAMNDKEVVLIQAKSWRNKLPDFQEEKKKLADLLTPKNVRKVFCVYQIGSGKMIEEEIK